jgi:hypothetical protein
MSREAEREEQLRELTTLPRVNPDLREAAFAIGIKHWDDPEVNAHRLGIGEATYGRRLDAVLAANQADSPIVLPERFSAAEPTWRRAAALELFVDFETVSDLADDFSRLPQTGGQALIFQIGCGYFDADGRWRFAQWTVDRLTIADEAAAIDGWFEHVRSLAHDRNLSLADIRICHWSPAEVSTLETAYNAARTRHPEADWPEADELGWFDLLERVARAEPLTVTGAFGFGLKPIAKAMHAQGLITTSWADGPTDGLGAMVGAWWSDAEAARLGVSMRALPLMASIGRYNEVDCRVLAETLGWLRENR